MLVVIILLLFTCQQKSICSNFDNNDEGWTVTGDVQNAFAKPDYHEIDNVCPNGNECWLLESYLQITKVS